MLRDLLRNSHPWGQHSLVSTNSVIQRQRLFAAKHDDSYLVCCGFTSFVCHKRHFFLESWDLGSQRILMMQRLRLTGFDLELEKVGLLSEGHGDKDRVLLGKWSNGPMVTLKASFFVTTPEFLWGMSRWYQVHPHRKNSRYFVKNSCRCFQILGWLANRLEQSKQGWSSMIFMLTEECHDTELPEFHLTIGQLPLEEATNYHKIVEEEYVWIIVIYWRKLQMNLWCERNMRFLRNLQSIHLRLKHWSNLQKRSFNYPWHGTVMMSPFWQQPTRLSWWSAQLKQRILHQKCPVKLS